MTSYGFLFSGADLECPHTVLRSCLRMIEGRMFSLRRLFLKIKKTEIMKQPCPCSGTGITSELSGDEPGKIGYIHAVHESVRPLMLCITLQCHEVFMKENMLHFRQVVFRHFF